MTSVCFVLFLQRSWPALASQSCPSQDRRGIRNVPITELQLVKRRFLGSWKRQFKTKSNKQAKGKETKTNKQAKRKNDLWGLWMAKKSRATLWTNKILHQNRCRLVATVVISLDLFFFSSKAQGDPLLKSKRLDLGAEPPRIKLCWVVLLPRVQNTCIYEHVPQK